MFSSSTLSGRHRGGCFPSRGEAPSCISSSCICNIAMCCTTGPGNEGAQGPSHLRLCKPIKICKSHEKRMLQYSCRENPTDRGAWWATVHRVTKSWTACDWFWPMNHRRQDTGVSPLKTLKSLSGLSRFFLFPVVAMQMSAC